MLDDVEVSRCGVSCGEGLCALWPLSNLTHSCIEGLEMVCIISKTQCLIFFLLLHSTTELPAAPEVGGHCKNALTSDLIFRWLEQSIWWVIWGSDRWQWAVQCFAGIFHSVFGRAPGYCGSLQWLFHLHFQFSLHESSISHRQPFRWPLILTEWLTDWAPMLHHFES